MLLLPAVDIAGGRCVRLLQGRPEDETVYFDSPAEAALQWQQRGAEALHVVDLDGALTGGGRNAGRVREILERADVPVEVAGGLRSTAAVRAALDAGAARAVVGTSAVRDPEWAVGLCRQLPDRVVVALDARDGRVAVEGWRETTDVTPVELARRLAEGGPAAFLYTDVARDGMLTCPNFEAMEQLIEAVETPVIASGGVASVEDIDRLGRCGAAAVVVGKALYEGRFALAEALDAAARYPGGLAPWPAPQTQQNA